MNDRGMKSDDPREKLLRIMNIFKENTSTKLIKIPKNFLVLLRKLYKYIKPKLNLIDITFDELEQIDKEKQYLLGIDNLWMSIKLMTKEWIFNFFSACNFIIENNESINPQLEFYLLNCFNVIKEICRHPPKEVFNLNEDMEINKELLYLILDYFIILNDMEIFLNVFDIMINYSENSKISYKFYVILKKFCLKYLKIKSNGLGTTTQSTNYFEISNSNKYFTKFIDVTLSSLKTSTKTEDPKQKNSLFSIFFAKNKIFLSKELDGSNIVDFFTILNTSEEYSPANLNNTVVFSVSFEIINFIYNENNNNTNEKILWAFKELKSVLHSYCIRIFDQSENYLESNKNKTLIDQTTVYNLNLIESSVWESLKIINLICKLDTTLVSNINMRMKQVYERIALKQSGLVFLEILQFFIDNSNLIIVDLDYYVSEFFKLKLKYNYKYEILTFTTLEFLYKNKEILERKTQVFNLFFPLIIKIFATFPKYLDTKFFALVEYMTKPTTIAELFNYILDLPAIILIIENFECYNLISNSSIYNNNESILTSSKINIEDIFQLEYAKTVEILLRDLTYEQEFQFSLIYTSEFNKRIKTIFESLIFTSRVHSTTKIVPKLMKKFFDVIIQRDEKESASETILLIFERFANFYENEHYKQEIQNLLIRKLEQMFKKWPKIVTCLRENILLQIKKNYSNSTKRELICLLTWSLGEFLDKQLDNSFEDIGIAETFECLETLLRDKIKFFQNRNRNEVPNFNSSTEGSVEDVLKWYSTYYIDKTTEEEIANERRLIILINTLGKLSIKFKSYVSRIIKCFKDIDIGLLSANKNLHDKLSEMLISLEHISISTEYLI